MGAAGIGRVHEFDEETRTSQSTTIDTDRIVYSDCTLTTVDWDVVPQCRVRLFMLKAIPPRA